MQVHIIGPNLPDQSKGSFHVHAFGCADVQRNHERAPDFAYDRTNPWDVTSRIDAAAQTFADQIDEGSMTAEDGVHDMWFAPCVSELPHDDIADRESDPRNVPGGIGRVARMLDS